MSTANCTLLFFFFFQAEDGIRDKLVTGVQTCALPNFERKGLRTVAAELRAIDLATARRHYAEHEDKPFFDDLVSFITRSPVMLLVVEGPPGAEIGRASCRERV